MKNGIHLITYSLGSAHSRKSFISAVSNVTETSPLITLYEETKVFAEHPYLEGQGPSYC